METIAVDRWMGLDAVVAEANDPKFVVIWTWLVLGTETHLVD